MSLVQSRTANRVQILQTGEKSRRTNEDHVQERREHGENAAIDGIDNQKIEQFVRSVRE